MFMVVIVFFNVIIMISEPLQSIFNSKTQYLAPQMCRECRFLCRSSILDSKNFRKTNIRGLNITGIHFKDIAIIVHQKTSNYKPANWSRKPIFVSRIEIH